MLGAKSSLVIEQCCVVNCVISGTISMWLVWLPCEYLDRCLLVEDEGAFHGYLT
jgi:hypothetical protein